MTTVKSDFLLERNSQAFDLRISLLGRPVLQTDDWTVVLLRVEPMIRVMISDTSV